jgi:hypothetical protein
VRAPPLKRGEGRKGTVIVVVGTCASPEKGRAIVMEGVRAHTLKGGSTTGEGRPMAMGANSCILHIKSLNDIVSLPMSNECSVGLVWLLVQVKINLKRMIGNVNVDLYKLLIINAVIRA